MIRVLLGTRPLLGMEERLAFFGTTTPLVVSGVSIMPVFHEGGGWRPPTRINDANSDGVHPSAVWNKKTKEYGVVWWDSRVGGTYFARVNRKGNVIAETPVSTLGPSGYYRPRIGTSGDEYATVWEEWVSCNGGKCPEMAFARVASDGSKIGTDQVITAYGATRAKSIVWNGSEWGVLAGFGHYAKLLRVSTTGDILEPPVPLDSIFMSNARMIWTGREYVVTWIDGDVKLQTFDRNGNPTRDRHASISDRWPKLELQHACASWASHWNCLGR